MLTISISQRASTLSILFLLIRTSRQSQVKDCIKSFHMLSRDSSNSDRMKKLVCKPGKSTLYVTPFIHHSYSERLLTIFQHNRSDVAIVFCNTVPSCDWTAHFLTNNDIPVVKLHGGFSPLVRTISDSCIYMSLIGSVCLQDRKNLLKEFKEGKSRILVCTDIASRGIDSSHVRRIK